MKHYVVCKIILRRNKFPVPSIKWNWQLNCLKQRKQSVVISRCLLQITQRIFKFFYFKRVGARDELSMYLRVPTVSQIEALNWRRTSSVATTYRLLSIKALVASATHSSFPAMHKVGKFGFVVQIQAESIHIYYRHGVLK